MQYSNINYLNFGDLKNAELSQKLLMVVTKDGSLYQDDKWSYGGEIQQKNLKKSQTIINWEVDLKNGDYLTDEKYEVLLNACKDYVLCLRVGHNKRQSVSKATTVIKSYKCLISLVRWMVSEYFVDFYSLDASAVERYVQYLRISNGRFKKPISNGELFKRLSVINEIWKYKDSISNSILTNPFPTQTPFELSGITKAKQAELKFDFVPDEIAVSLGEIITNYIEKLSKNILDADEAVRFVFDETLLMKSKAEADRRARKVANKFGYKYVKDLTADVGHLRTACYIAVAMFTGIRDSEISSLNVKCVEHDVAEGYIWVNGFIYKTSDNKSNARWMAPPIVDSAIKVVERLTYRLRKVIGNEIDKLNLDIHQPLTTGKTQAALRSKLNSLTEIQNALWLVQSSKLGNSVSTNKSIHEQLIQFMKHHNIPLNDGKFGTCILINFVEHLFDLWSKNSMNLKYLQEHFKHFSLDMTAWYDIDDVALSQDIVDYYNEVTNETLKSIVDSNQVAGKGGEIINQVKNHFFQGMVIESRDKVIKAMADTVTLRSTGVSWCLGDVENGECSGVHGCMIDPSNVNKCSQAIITQEHLPAWQEIKLQNEEMLELDDLGVHQKGAIQKFLHTVVVPVINQLTR